MSPTQTIETQLRQLQTDYANKLSEKVQAAQQHWASVRRDPNDTNAIRRLRQVVHGLAGGAATFGLPEISAAAHPLAEGIQELLDSGQPPDAARLGHWESALQGLVRAADPVTRPHAPVAAAIPAIPAAATGERRRLYLVEDDISLASNVALQIGCFGYEVQIFTSPAGLLEAVRRDPPAAILMDIVFPEGGLAGTESIRKIREDGGQRVPVIFFSVRDDLMARLQAVQAGGNAFFTKPVDVNEIVDTLDRLTAPPESETHRILIVSDNPDEVVRIHRVLRQAGMQIAVVTNPFQIMPLLVEFHPDLIVMSYGMPECKGIDLARVIRQQKAYVGIPIVFLNPVDGGTDQGDTLQAAGDAVPTAPDKEEDLIEMVRAQANRARTMRSCLVQDSLTGLLNHTHLKEHLEREVMRARRHGQPLALGLLDIDYFRSVNETYGHTAGDRVIQNFARFLRQRLRRSDLLGRYGGDEFAVILPGAPLADARRVLDEIREGFSNVRQQSFHEVFRVTVSGGVTVLIPPANAQILCDAAHKVLDRAKHEGRNRVLTE